MRHSRNPVDDFNTAGQDKCPHCGDWFPSAWVLSHINSCPKKPKAPEVEETDQSS